MSKEISSIASLFALSPINHLTTPSQNPNQNVTRLYSYEFGFERLFESHSRVNAIKAWMQQNWAYSFQFAFLYLLIIYAGQAYMKNRPRFELRKPLIAWNLFLAAFSILGTIRAWPEFIDAVVNNGLVFSVCDTSSRAGYSIPGFWYFAFILSKLPEFVDTMFIVLRKQVRYLIRKIFLTVYR